MTGAAPVPERREAGRAARGAVLALIAVAAGGCGDAGGSAGSAEPRAAAGRQVEAPGWDTVFHLGGALEDTTLLIPRQLAARDGRLYVFDYGDSRLKSFDQQGELAWSFGSRGSGPEEFGNPVDLAVGPEGGVWVVDGGEGRLSVVSAEGQPKKLIRHPGVLVRDVVPLRDRLLVTTASPADTFWMELDSAGSVVETGRRPFPELAEADLLARQGYATVADDSRTWAAIFPFGRPFAVYEGTAVRCTGELIEGAAFPARMPQDPRSAVWAVAAALSGSSLFVLPRGRTDLALEVLDEYSAADCRYLRTIRLPSRVVALAASGDVFYFGRMEPAPSVLAARLRRP